MQAPYAFVYVSLPDLIGTSCDPTQFSSIKWKEQSPLIVGSDEFGSSFELQMAEYSWWGRVLRNFMHPRSLAAFPPHVVWIPLGFSHGGNEDLQAASKRRHAMSFLGNDGNQKLRHRWVSELELLEWEIAGNVQVMSFGHGSRDEYIRLMRETTYFLAPPGASIESFRLYDALEFGCIPVLLDEWCDEWSSTSGARSLLWHNLSEPLFIASLDELLRVSQDDDDQHARAVDAQQRLFISRWH